MLRGQDLQLVPVAAWSWAAGTISVDMLSSWQRLGNNRTCGLSKRVRVDTALRLEGGSVGWLPITWSSLELVNPGVTGYRRSYHLATEDASPKSTVLSGTPP